MAFDGTLLGLEFTPSHRNSYKLMLEVKGKHSSHWHEYFFPSLDGQH